MTTEEQEELPSIQINVDLKNIKDFSEYTETYNSIQAEFLDEDTLTSIFRKQIEKSFKENPTVLGVRWTQYTPYFNDGEPCTFSGPYSLYYSLAEESDESDSSQNDESSEEESNEEEDEYDDDEDDDSEYSELSSYRGTPEDLKIIESFKWITQLNDDFLLAMFGDDAQVTIRRDLTIKVSEYSHE